METVRHENNISEYLIVFNCIYLYFDDFDENTFACMEVQLMADHSAMELVYVQRP